MSLTDGWWEIKLLIKSQTSKADFNSMSIPEQLSSKVLGHKINRFLQYIPQRISIFTLKELCENYKITKMSITPERKVQFKWIYPRWASFLMLFNWIPSIATLFMPWWSLSPDPHVWVQAWVESRPGLNSGGLDLRIRLDSRLSWTLLLWQKSSWSGNLTCFCY